MCLLQVKLNAADLNIIFLMSSGISWDTKKPKQIKGGENYVDPYSM